MNIGKEKSNPKVVRGYLKLSSAAKAFKFDFRDKLVLDIGSSTGGFTEYALKNGAKKVIAVEKGTHQMKTPLRNDPRIELHEKTDIFDFKLRSNKRDSSEYDSNKRDSSEYDSNKRNSSEYNSSHHNSNIQKLNSDPRNLYPDVILADVSFISLTKILQYAKDNLANAGTDFLVMLKPQFEARPEDLHRGVVKNETIRRTIIKDFEYWLKANQFVIIKKFDNTLSGKHGNTARFYLLKLASSTKILLRH